MPFVMGRPLALWPSKCKKVLRQCNELKQYEQTNHVRVYIEVARNLMGETKNTSLLQEEYFDEMNWTPVNPTERGHAMFLKQALQVFFCEWEEAGDLALSRADEYEKLLQCHCILQTDIPVRGMVLYGAARKTGKRKYRKPAKKIPKRLKDMVKKENPNIPPMYHLLRTEEAALRRNKTDVATATF